MSTMKLVFFFATILYSNVYFESLFLQGFFLLVICLNIADH